MASAIEIQAKFTKRRRVAISVGYGSPLRQIVCPPVACRKPHHRRQPRRVSIAHNHVSMLCTSGAFVSPQSCSFGRSSRAPWCLCTLGVLAVGLAQSYPPSSTNCTSEVLQVPAYVCVGRCPSTKTRMACLNSTCVCFRALLRLSEHLLARWRRYI